MAEAGATVSAGGTITSIDIINSGRSYLPTQNIVVEISSNTGLATAVMEPIYYTVSEQQILHQLELRQSLSMNLYLMNCS